MQKVLIVAHEFPPIAGGQVMRMTKFAKYLPIYGWRPIIVTAEPEDCYHRSAWGMDPLLSDQIDETVMVLRSRSPLERMARNLANQFRQKSDTLSPHISVPDSNHLKRSRKSSAIDHLRRFHVFQDESALWLPYAYTAALRMIHRERPQVLITTSPPHLLQLTGYMLKRKTGIRWIADFRDGWTDNTLFRSDSSVRLSFDNMIERLIIKNADVVVVVTKHMLDSLRNRYPRYAGKIRLIYNGYDGRDFEPVRRSLNRSSERVVFSHVGNWGGHRDPSILIRAFEELFDEKRLDRDRVTLRLIGSGDRVSIAIPDWVDIQPPVTHNSALQQMVDADVLVLLADIKEREAAFTSKVFEYLAAQRPILAIIPTVGELAELLKEYSLGVIASADDVNQVKQAVLTASREASENNLLTTSDLEIIHRFDREHQTLQLVELFQRLEPNFSPA